MKIKFNWGTGIVLFIVIFTGSVFARILISSQHKINLVTPEYYPKEMEHGKHITQIKNYIDLEEKIVIEKISDGILFKYPELLIQKKIVGTICFYRPSDYEKDVTIEIAPNEEQKQIVSNSGLLMGRYIIQIEFKIDDTRYYYEEGYYKD